MEQPLDPFVAQPRCPKCGTVLRDVKAGYVCRGCNEAFVLRVDEGRS